MAEKKTKIMSLSVPPDFHDTLKNAAKTKGVSVSELVRKMGRYIDLITHDDEEIPVILKVPVSLKGDESGLRAWLNNKTDTIVKTLAPPT